MHCCCFWVAQLHPITTLPPLTLTTRLALPPDWHYRHVTTIVTLHYLPCVPPSIHCYASTPACTPRITQPLLWLQVGFGEAPSLVQPQRQSRDPKLGFVSNAFSESNKRPSTVDGSGSRASRQRPPMIEAASPMAADNNCAVRVIGGSGSIES